MKNYDYEVSVPSLKVDGLADWCYKNIKICNWNKSWIDGWCSKQWTFYFKNKIDYDNFIVFGDSYVPSQKQHYYMK